MMIAHNRVATLVTHKTRFLAIMRPNMVMINDTGRKTEPLPKARPVQYAVEIDPLATVVGPCLATECHRYPGGYQCLLKGAKMLADHDGPNVNRLSCRPPAGGGYQPTTPFYSRASPVNCSRWLGRIAQLIRDVALLGGFHNRTAGTWVGELCSSLVDGFEQCELNGCEVDREDAVGLVVRLEEPIATHAIILIKLLKSDVDRQRAA